MGSWLARATPRTTATKREKVMFYSKQYRTHTQWRSHVLRPANATNSHIFSLHLTTTSQILANSVFYFFFRSFHNFRGIKQMTLHAIHIACATEIEYNFLAMWQKRTELRTFAILHNSLQALFRRKFRASESLLAFEYLFLHLIFFFFCSSNFEWLDTESTESTERYGAVERLHLTWQSTLRFY